MVATLHGHTIFHARQKSIDEQLSSEPELKIVEFQVTTAGGVSVSLDTTGATCMRKSKAATKSTVAPHPTSLKAQNEDAGNLGKETLRQVLSNGTVIKTSEGKATIFFMNGDISEQMPSEEYMHAWMNTSTKGER